MPVGIARPVWGHLIMTMPTLVSSRLVSVPCPVAIGWVAPLLTGEVLGPAYPGGLHKYDYEAFCRTLVRLFLIGSAVSVASFRASSQSSLLCADVVSKFLRLCVVDSWTISDSVVVPMRWVRKSKAEVALTD